MFDTTKEDLKKLLEKVEKGEIQLPEFQRDYVWQDEDVRSLIASIVKGFPVGALLTLEQGSNEVQFKTRLIEGVEKDKIEPQELLLDGQQRVTSLFQATFSNKPIRTKTHKNTVVERYYYLDIKKAIEHHFNFEEAIKGVPADKKIKRNFGKEVALDLSKEENEFHYDLFPLNKIFESKDWLYNWRDYWKARDRDVNDLERQFDKDGVIETVVRYEVPIIRLDKNNSREAICTVFEKVNVGGKKLDAFELVTAMYAAQNFDLRKDWLGSKKDGDEGRLLRMVGSEQERKVLKDIASTDFLQACTILHTRNKRLKKYEEGYEGKELPQVACHRDALLSLPLDAYQSYADSVEEGFKEAAYFLNEQKILRPKELPYPPLLVGLAATYAILGKEGKTMNAKEKLEKWFWSVTLGELYGSATESRLARDVQELVSWIREEEGKPTSISEAFFQQNRLKALKNRKSAAYKALHALLMKAGCQDFVSGKPADIMTFFNDPMEIHHIFPKDWCKSRKIEPKIYNSIVNKTPISDTSNRSIGGKAPSEYLKKIEDQHGIDSHQLNEILKTHLIEPEFLRNDDFDSFFNARLEALTQLVEEVMDNKVVREDGSNEEEYEPAIDEDILEENLFEKEETE